MELVSAVIADAREQILDSATTALLALRRPHYSGPETRGRLADLLAQLDAGVTRGDPDVMARYCRWLAAERLAAGFAITELQAAFNVVEEAVWSQVVAAVDGPDQLRALQLVSTTMRAGRDALVETYVELAAAGPSDAAAPAEHPLVAIDVRGDVGVLKMNDPVRRNALSNRMVEGIADGLESLIDQGVRAVVLRAETGLAVWSSGHDIRELPRGRRDPLAYDDPLGRCLRAVRIAPIPVIAMVHGSVWGGAFDLVLSCDVVIADETATFAITPANLGLPYSTTGLLHFFGRVPLNVVKEMFFTAAPVDARQAERWTIINHLIDSAELEQAAFALAGTMAAKAPLAIATVKEQLRVLTDYQPVAAQVFERIQGLRRQAYDSDDYLEGLAAFAEKRPPRFRGQ